MLISFYFCHCPQQSWGCRKQAAVYWQMRLASSVRQEMCYSPDPGVGMFEFKFQLHDGRHCVLGQMTELLFPWCLYSQNEDNNSTYCKCSLWWLNDLIYMKFLAECLAHSEWKVKVSVAQSCPTLSNPVDCSLPGSSVRGILQARILEWVAMPFSRGPSRPRDRAQVSCIAGGFFTIWATRET